MEIIGLSGYARTGKDEAANALVEEGFIRVAFADKLREFLYAQDPIVKSGFGFDITVQNVIDKYGWDGYKETEYKDEIRRQLQRLGTDAGRRIISDTIWVDAAFAGLPEDAKIVLTDCRFPNEAEAVKERGGQVWRIIRPGIGPINDHPSETSLDDWKFDFTLNNDADLETLHIAIRNLYHIKRSKP